MIDPLIQSTVQKAEYLLPASKFASEILAHAKTHRENLAQLKKAAASDNKALVKKIQDRILKSHSSHLVCLIRSLEKSPGLTPEYVQNTAAALNPWKTLTEPVTAWAEPKPLGRSWRPIVSPGPMRKALQTICADIIQAKFGVDEVDCLSKGRGAEIASDRIVHLVEEKGFRYFVLGDVEDFYGSVQQKSIAGITGLPGKVVNNCLLLGPDVPLSLLNVLPIGVTIQAFDGAVRRGLPQGSRASIIIASLLLGPTLREVSSADRIVVYGDDCAIAAGSEKEAKALQTELAAVLKSHTAGPFQVKVTIGDAKYGFDFLKYRMKRSWVTGAVHRRPSSKCYRRFSEKVAKRWKAGKDGPKAMIMYRKVWMESFRRWPWNGISKELLWLTSLEAIWKAAKESKQPKPP